MIRNEIVMTLDAGGTNFVFSAVKNAEEIVNPVAFPSQAHDLDLCLANIIKGFESIEKQMKKKATAISFAFPGPADYENGIIGDLGNLPAFRGGVALGPMLEEKFNMPVFINNDGDLFAYGEAMYGILPHINKKLKEAGSLKQFKNLIGLTLGTGFGGGLVRNNELIIGDNAAAAEVWLLRNPFNNKCFAEENISARAITREYAAMVDTDPGSLKPIDVYNIAQGNKTGHRQAAIDSFHKFGRALGISIAEIATLMDGLIVIGGGLTNAWDLFYKEMFSALNENIENLEGEQIPRLVMKVHNLNLEESFRDFALGQKTVIKVPFSDKMVNYDPVKRIGVGRTFLGASKATSLGAYAYALNKINPF